MFFDKIKQEMTGKAFWLGILFIGILATFSTYVASISKVKAIGFSALTIAILLGILIGNTVFAKLASVTTQGVDFSKNRLLRLGIICYGFRITFQQINMVGWSGIIIAVLMVACTFSVAIYLGIYVFKLDKQTAILIGAGSSICGAAAVMAAEPVVKGQAHKVSVAVATVVVFGTLGMFLYPVFYKIVGMSAHFYGLYVGSTVHEVAQVVVAGNAVSETAANMAVIEKMIRVMLLAPFLVLLSMGYSAEIEPHQAKKTNIVIPWFAVLFIVVAVINSVISIPVAVLTWINTLDTFILTMAMAALGVRTHIGAVKQAGIKPLLLAASLFAFLVVGGYLINSMVLSMVGNA